MGPSLFGGRFLCGDPEGPSKFGAKVVRINPQSILLKQRVLIEMYGRWDKHEPMSSPDFEPLVI